MSGTTVDKLNYLKSTKELLRQEINNDFPDLGLSTSDTFRQYPSKISSSQLWMDAWISGGIEYSIVYNGTNAFNTGCRDFKNILMPNANNASFSHITADTVIIGGPSNLVSSMFRNSSVEKVYVNNLKRIDIGSKDASLSDSGSSIREIHLPLLDTAAGKKSFLLTSFAINGYDIYLPRITRIGNYAIKGTSSGGHLHIGTELSTVCSLESTSGISSSISQIYVPASLVNSYKSATNWSALADRIQAEPGT